jgi:hypothetical protein
MLQGKSDETLGLFFLRRISMLNRPAIVMLCLLSSCKQAPAPEGPEAPPIEAPPMAVQRAMHLLKPTYNAIKNRCSAENLLDTGIDYQDRTERMELCATTIEDLARNLSVLDDYANSEYGNETSEERKKKREIVSRAVGHIDYSLLEVFVATMYTASGTVCTEGGGTKQKDGECLFLQNYNY